jgi:hypothetical protein
MNEKILKIPYSVVREDWDFLQKYLKAIGNPRYILVGDVDLFRKQDISDLGNLVGVEGYLDLYESSIESLGELEFVKGDLCLFRCKNIKRLENLKKVEGDLWLSRSSVESLGNLQFVGGNLYLIDSSIVSLGELKFVGGNLQIQHTNISQFELNNVEVVGRIIG